MQKNSREFPVEITFDRSIKDLHANWESVVNDSISNEVSKLTINDYMVTGESYNTVDIPACNFTELPEKIIQLFRTEFYQEDGKAKCEVSLNSRWIKRMLYYVIRVYGEDVINTETFLQLHYNIMKFVEEFFETQRNEQLKYLQEMMEKEFKNISIGYNLAV